MSVCVVHAGRLIDGLGHEVTGNMSLVIADGVIVEAGTRVRTPADATVYNFPGGTLLPGLVDAHVHLVWSGDAVPHKWVAGRHPARVVLRMAAAALTNLRAGVTTVRDLGATDGLSIPLAAAIRDGDIPGPRVIAAGRALAMTGGHAWQIAREADGVDAVRSAVRSEIKAGARCIKIMASGGVYDERAGLDEAQLTTAEMTAAVEEAHKAGLMVAAHAYTAGPINAALDAGVDSIEHGSFLDQPTAERMRALGAFLVPTLTASELMVRNAEVTGTPGYMLEKVLAVREAGRRAARLALRVGTKLAGGSDAGGAGIPHGSLATEVNLLMRCGASLEQAVQICTSQSSAVCGLSDIAGALSVGFGGDLMVVDGELSDVATRMHQPQFVMTGGIPVTL